MALSRSKKLAKTQTKAYQSTSLVLLKTSLLLLIASLLISCATKEKPKYLLTDSQLREFSAGDQLSYAVLDNNALGDTIRNYSVSYVNESLAAPDNTTLNALIEDYTNSSISPLPFITRIFSQNADGDLILQGFKHANENYWLVEDDLTQTGITFYQHDLAAIVDTIDISRPLKLCANKICDSKGQLNLSLKKEKTETVETPYAIFESYKFKLALEITIQGENPVYHYVKGDYWFHPAIGIVKFALDVSHEFSDTSIIGTLTDTNISIPSRYKNN